MNDKLKLALAVMVLAVAFVGLSSVFDESDAATINAKTFFNTHSEGDVVYYEYQTITITDVTEGVDEYFCRPATFTLSASNTSQIVTVYNTYDDDPDQSTSYNVTFVGTAPITNYTVTIVAGTGGTVSGDTSFSVPSGTSVSASGSTITIGSHTAYASANPDYTFSGWSQSSGTITSNTTITASFTYTPPAPTYYTVTVVAGTGGSVSGDTSFSVESGTSVSASGSTLYVGSYTAYASANPDYTFSSWSKSSGTITTNTTITASFTYTPPAPTTYTVTFAVSPSGYGTVSQNYIYNVPSGASITVSDNIVTINGTTVTATPIDATSGYAYSFSSWSNTSGTVTANRTITANFTRTAVDYILSAENLALAPGTTSYYYYGGGTIAINDVIDGLQEYLARPSVFTLDSNNPSQVVTVYDNYDDDPSQSTSFNVTFYATQTITVVPNDPDYGSVSSGSISNVPYGSSITVSNNTITVNGTTVTATASSPSGGYTYAFDNWSNTSGTVTADRTITANFTRTAIPTVFMNVNVGSGNGSVYVTDNNGNTSPTSTDSTYVYLEVQTGTTITIHAVPDTGYAFQSWGTTPLPATYTFTISNNRSLSANFVSAPSTHTVSFDVNPSGYGTVSQYNIQNVPDGASITVSNNTITVNGTTVTATASSPSGGYTYAFDNWSNTSGTITADRTITANFTRTAIPTVFMNVNVGSGNGSVYVTDNNGNTSPTSTDSTYVYLEVQTGTTITIHAVPDTGYAFQSWGTTPLPATYTFTISNNRSLSANFTEILPPEDGVYWSNNLFNGSVSILYRFNPGSGNMGHNMTIPLYSGTVDGQNVTTWTATGDVLEISITYPNKAVITTGGVISPVTVDLGSWTTFILTVDSDKGQLIFTPVDRFTNFQQYRTMDSQSRVIADWSSVTKNNSTYEITHEDSGSGNRVKFQVVNTATFLDTYGVVMTDPSINVYQYFPEYQNVRLNFYSFALYGDSMTINNITWPVENGQVTLWFTTVDKKNYIATSSTEGASSKTFTLSNIYITWEGQICYLTFVNEKNWTVDLGSYSAGQETVSFTGFWYFTSFLYEPHTETEKAIVGDWEYVPDIGSTAMLLIFLGTLFVGGMIAHVKVGLKWLDMIILISGIVMSFTLLG